MDVDVLSFLQSLLLRGNEKAYTLSKNPSDIIIFGIAYLGWNLPGIRPFSELLIINNN